MGHKQSIVQLPNITGPTFTVPVVYDDDKCSVHLTQQALGDEKFRRWCANVLDENGKDLTLGNIAYNNWFSRLLPHIDDIKAGNVSVERALFIFETYWSASICSDKTCICNTPRVQVFIPECVKAYLTKTLEDSKKTWTADALKILRDENEHTMMNPREGFINRDIIGLINAYMEPPKQEKNVLIA